MQVAVNSGDMAKHLPASFFFDGAETERLPSVMEERRRKQAVWLEVWAAQGWRAACEAAGCTDRDILRWRRIDPEFRSASEAQHDAIATALEAVCDSIARGEAQATAQQVALLQFRLRALRPEVYRERVAVAAVAQDGDGGGGEGGRARLLLAEWTS